MYGAHIKSARLRSIIVGEDADRAARRYRMRSVSETLKSLLDRDRDPGDDQATGPEASRGEYAAMLRGFRYFILVIYLSGIALVLATEAYYYFYQDKQWYLIAVDLVVFNIAALLLAVLGYALVKRTWLRAYVSESTLLSITDISSDAVYALDTEMRITAWSKGAKRVFGYELDEVSGRHFSFILPAGEETREAEVLSELMEKGVVTGHRTSNVRKDGEVFPSEMSGTLLRGPEGEPTGMLVVLRDVSDRVSMENRLREARDELEIRVEERTAELKEANLEMTRQMAALKRAERELEEAHSELRTEKDFIDNAVNTMEDIFVVFDLSGSFLMWNKSACRVTGYEDEEIKGMNVTDFFAPEDLPDIQAGIELGLSRGFARVEAGLRNRRGDLVQHEFYGTPLKDESGDNIGAIVIGRNTSERNRLAEIEKGTAAAMAAAEVARADAEELKDLIEVAAHELRHPATLFKGYAYTLLEQSGDLDGETARYALKSINDGADRLIHIVNELFETTLMERNRFKLTRERVNSSELVTRAVEEMAARGVTNTFDSSRCDDGRSLYVDPVRITDVLVILLDNAVKYSPREEPVEVWCRGEAEEALFYVADRGPGIPESGREKVFERFYQVEDVLHHSLPGLGLGLYLARRIVEAHQGWIGVEERDGGGAVFRFAVPVSGPRQD